MLKEALECSIHEATGMHCNVIYLILYVVNSYFLFDCRVYYCVTEENPDVEQLAMEDLGR